MHQHRYRLPYKARSVAGLLALALVAAACGGKGEPSVSVKGLDADVVFGVKAKAAGPGANSAQPQELGAEEEIALVVEEEGGAGARRTIRQQIQASPTCPEASINAFPKEAASEQVRRRPTEGLYRWKRAGASKLAALNGQEQKHTGFEERIVQNVRLESESENPATEYADKSNAVFTYETVQPFGGGVLVSTYRVKTNAAVQREAKPFTGNPRVRTGDPERGLSLISERYVDADGGAQERDFSPGLLIVPLPISPGEKFTSVSQVSREGTVEFDGEVTVKERIDACGDIVEGYRVKGRMDRGGRTETYNLLVATQLGALLIQEHFEFSDLAGQHVFTFELGQLVPSPVGQAQQ